MKTAILSWLQNDGSRFFCQPETAFTETFYFFYYINNTFTLYSANKITIFKNSLISLHFDFSSFIFFRLVFLPHLMPVDFVGASVSGRWGSPHQIMMLLSSSLEGASVKQP